MGVTYFVAPIFYVNVYHHKRRFFPLKNGQTNRKDIVKRMRFIQKPSSLCTVCPAVPTPFSYLFGGK